MSLYSIPPLISALAFCALAVLVRIRGATGQTERLFLAICFFGALLCTDTFLLFTLSSPRIALWMTRAGLALTIFLIPAYVHFFHSYLGIERRPWLITVAYGYAVCIMALTPTPLILSGVRRHFFGYFGRGGPLYPLVGLGAGAAVIYVMVLIHGAMRRAKSRVQQRRLKFVSAGFGLLGLLIGGNVLTVLGLAVYPPGSFAFFPLAVFAYGLFRYDVLDMGLLVRRSLIYSATTALLTGGYALTVTVAQRMISGFRFADSLWVPVGFFLLVALVFGPLRDRIQVLVDLSFEKRRTDYQRTLLTVSRTIASVLDQDRIAGELLDTVADALGVARCALYLERSDGSGMGLYAARRGEAGPAFPLRANDMGALVAFLSEGRIAFREAGAVGPAAGICEPVEKALVEAEVVIALPLLFQTKFNGFVLLGEKRAGDRFTPGDLALLETLAGQSALAVENARAYKIIAEMNRTLEAKVRQRTAELEQALAEKERSQEMLIRSESLAAIGQLVAGTAHELNNPLTSVKSLLQSTLEDLAQWDGSAAPDGDWIEDLRFADSELSRARDIVSSLLDLSRQTQTYREAVDLTRVVQRALRVLHSQIKRLPVRVVQNLDPDLPAVRGNFANLGQVALNIIKNAFQAVDGQGMVTVATCFDEKAQEVIFSCTDTGPGIAPSLRQNIFKPFFTTKEVGQGTGLGLYLCHEIVARHGGRIVLDPGPETTFRVRLPLSGGGASP